VPEDVEDGRSALLVPPRHATATMTAAVRALYGEVGGPGWRRMPGGSSQ